MEISKKIKKIKRVNVIDNQDVYDITIENNHNFFANGTLVHNCVEIGMQAYDKDGNSGWEFCNLCELNMKKATTEEKFYEACRAAALIGTIQTSYNKFPYLGEITNNIVAKDALLGVSMTGMADVPDIAFDPRIQRKGAKIILDVNERLAPIIGVNKCARSTCVKPAGCLYYKTKIKTNDGIKSLEDIFRDQGYNLDDYKHISDMWLELKKPLFVYNENNELECVTKLYINGMESTYEIPLEDGNVYKCTPWHKFKLIDGTWKRADELQKGDDILTF